MAIAQARAAAMEERKRRAAAWKREIAGAPAAKARAMQARALADDDVWASIAEATRIGFRHCDCDAAWRSITATLSAAIVQYDAGRVSRDKIDQLRALRSWFWVWAPKAVAQLEQAA